MTSLNFFDAIRDTILIGIHNYKYKNGAFVSKIFKDTPVASTFDILIASPLTTASEKNVFQSSRNMFVSLREKFPGAKQPDLLDLVPYLTTVGFDALGNVFTADAKARGLYVPPTTLQVVNAEGSISKTISINDDGSSTSMNGGIPCIPVGTPEEFIKSQEANIKLFTKSKTADDKSEATGKNGNAAKNTTKKGTAKVDPAMKDTGFGKEFSKNMKGAFI